MSIIVEGLYHIYMKGSPFEKVALKDVNMRIDDGEFVGIIGHTGSGKSTLVQHFNGLLKPSAGKVIINGTDTSEKNLKELRRQVGLVFQYPEHQLFEETVYKEVAFGLVKQGMEEDRIKDRVRWALGMVGLGEEYLEKSPFELSGGQKRRVAIAGVIALKPSILVLDEPAAGLDPKGREEIFSFISNLHATMGITVILVSHSMEDIARLTKRVIVMNKGTVEMDGAPADVFQNAEKLEEIGLSVPQITYLMMKLKKVIPEINEKIFTVAEAKNEIAKYLGGIR